MVTYKGKHYEEFAADKTIVFDPPRKAIFWDSSPHTRVESDISTGEVLAYIPDRVQPVISKRNSWFYCALLPDTRRATKRELSMWLAKGKGEVCIQSCHSASPCYAYDPRESEEKVPDRVMIRTWDDVVWHEPTADYMGLEE